MRPVELWTGRHSAGFSLLEVLIALVILSIGLLGLARMQMTGLKYATSAAHRLEGVNLANDILERMRANHAQAVAGDYDIRVGQAPSATGLAQADLEEWKAALAAGLPEGDGAITVKDRVVTINVQWLEGLDSSRDSGLATVYLRTQL